MSDDKNGSKKIGCCLDPIPQEGNAVTLPVLCVELPGRNKDEKGGRSHKLCIGRNDTTKITDETVARILALLEYSEELAEVKILKDCHELHLNDDKITETSAFLREGDILYLLSGKRYGYKVHYYDEKSDSKSMTKKAEMKKTIQLARHTMAEEFTCSICMDILVKSQVCHPCGHLFCESCIPCIDDFTKISPRKGRKKKQLSCPTCRATPIKLSPLKALDNVIWTMTLQGGCYFSKDDVEHYLKRTGKLEELTSIENDCIFGRFDKEGKLLVRHKKRKQIQLPSSTTRRKLHPGLFWTTRRSKPLSNPSNTPKNNMYPNKIVDLSSSPPSTPSNDIQKQSSFLHNSQGNTADDAICLD